MCPSLAKKIAKLLRSVADKLDAGNTDISESEALAIASAICHESLSKAQACEYLNISRNKFDGYIRLNKLPRGQKIKGFKELRWYKDELDEYSKNLKK